MLKRFLEQAMKDEPVYITDVREAFGREGTLPFDLAITLYDGSTRFFPMMLPVTHSREEKDFVCSYIKATVYNLLSSLGGEKMEIFTDSQDICLMDLAARRTKPIEIKAPAKAAATIIREEMVLT